MAPRRKGNVEGFPFLLASRRVAHQSSVIRDEQVNDGVVGASIELALSNEVNCELMDSSKV